MLDTMTQDQLDQLAKDASDRVRKVPEDQRMDAIVFAEVLRQASMFMCDAKAYRKYLAHTDVTAAMLARRFVSDPAVEIRDDGPHVGWVVLIRHDDFSGDKLTGHDGPYTKEQAARIAAWIREYGAHVLESARNSATPSLTHDLTVDLFNRPKGAAKRIVLLAGTRVRDFGATQNRTSVFFDASVDGGFTWFRCRASKRDVTEETTR